MVMRWTEVGREGQVLHAESFGAGENVELLATCGASEFWKVTDF